MLLLLLLLLSCLWLVKRWLWLSRHVKRLLDGDRGALTLLNSLSRSLSRMHSDWYYLEPLSVHVPALSLALLRELVRRQG